MFAYVGDITLPFSVITGKAVGNPYIVLVSANVSPVYETTDRTTAVEVGPREGGIMDKHIASVVALLPIAPLT
jgi:hypothetical protein